jgi:GAF domain-containing protein
MSSAPDTTSADPQLIIAELRRERDEAQEQLAQRTAERDEALAREAAIAEVLGVINSSPGNLAPVFDAILENAHLACGASFGALVLYDGEQLRAAATRGYPEEYAALIRKGVSPDHVSAFRLLRQGERVVHVRDAAELPSLPPVSRAAVEIGGVRTSLSIPLRREGALLGYISAQRGEVRPYSDQEIALLENFAAQAVIAMENARLITETREALEQQTATAEVLGVINSSPGDLSPVFEAVLEKALSLCEAALGVVARFDGEGFHWVAARGVPEDYLADPAMVLGGQRPASGISFYRLIHGEDLVHIEDITADGVYQSGNPGRRRFAELFGARTAIWLALRKEEALLGALVIYRREVRPFTDKQIALLQNFAAQAVIAMENARLITETREALDQQTATAEVLGVINASPGDLAPVFDAILEKARALCGAAHGALVAYDGEQCRGLALHEMPEVLGNLLREPFTPDATGLPARLVRGELLVHVPDQSARSRTHPKTRAGSVLAAHSRVPKLPCKTLKLGVKKKPAAVVGSADSHPTSVEQNDENDSYHLSRGNCKFRYFKTF